jgi:hypothetical protein
MKRLVFAFLKEKGGAKNPKKSPNPLIFSHICAILQF